MSGTAAQLEMATASIEATTTQLGATSALLEQHADAIASAGRDLSQAGREFATGAANAGAGLRSAASSSNNALERSGSVISGFAEGLLSRASDAQNEIDKFLLGLPSSPDDWLRPSDRKGLADALALIEQGCLNGSQAANVLDGLQFEFEGHVLKLTEEMKRQLLDRAEQHSREIRDQLNELDQEGGSLPRVIELLNGETSAFAKHVRELIAGVNDGKIPIDFVLTYMQELRKFLPDDSALDQILVRLLKALGVR